MAGLIAVKNISTGARGAYANGVLVMAEVGETIEADDFADEWFEVVAPAKAAPKPEHVKVDARATK